MPEMTTPNEPMVATEAAITDPRGSWIHSLKVCRAGSGVPAFAWIVCSCCSFMGSSRFAVELVLLPDAYYRDPAASNKTVFAETPIDQTELMPPANYGVRVGDSGWEDRAGAAQAARSGWRKRVLTPFCDPFLGHLAGLQCGKHLSGE